MAFQGYCTFCSNYGEGILPDLGADFFTKMVCRSNDEIYWEVYAFLPALYTNPTHKSIVYGDDHEKKASDVIEAPDASI